MNTFLELEEVREPDFKGRRSTRVREEHIIRQEVQEAFSEAERRALRE